MEISDEARKGAENTCEGMILHDEEEYEKAKERFVISDKILFDICVEAAQESAQAYVDALREKDRLEKKVDKMQYLRHTDWSPVREEFRKRAEAIGIPNRYAKLVTKAWRNHKLNMDYWTPYLEAQRLLIKTAISRQYPRKTSDGHSGHGPEPAKYLVAIELHDLHTDERYEQAISMVESYFETIIRLRRNEISK